jgi:hypothetical protein
MFLNVAAVNIDLSKQEFVALDGREASRIKPLSFPKIKSGRIDGAVQPGSEWWRCRQSVGPLDEKAHLSVMPSASALDCNTPHKRKELAAGASR